MEGLPRGPPRVSGTSQAARSLSSHVPDRGRDRGSKKVLFYSLKTEVGGVLQHSGTISVF